VKRICKICGELEENHHRPEWVKIPDGCVCDFGEWDLANLKAIPKPCRKYEGDGKQNCLKCEHDKACHTLPIKEAVQ
jgi:hypothetical protein